jgi:tyrosine-protein kinase Etk/Wzc
MSQVPQDELLPHADEPLRDEGIDLFALTVALLLEWRTAAVTAVIVSLVCILYIASLKSEYVATASFLPQEDASMVSRAPTLYGHDPGGLYIGLLASRSVQDALIDDPQLATVFQGQTREASRGRLALKSKFFEGTDEIVTINVHDRNPQNAAKIANGYLDALQAVNDKMSLIQTAQARNFYEQQLVSEKEELAQAEDRLEKTQKVTGLVAPDAQMQIGLSAIANTRAQINALEAQLAGILQSETEENPQVLRIRSQIAQLHAQETTLEKGASSPVGAAQPTGQLPENNLDYLRAQREVKYHETLVTSLASQFESARLSADFARSTFRIIDCAIVPTHTGWPPRVAFILAAIVFGVFMGLVVIVLKLLFRRVIKDPRHRASLVALRGVFGAR